jgi:uncharacterized RDD family membrane protein YckC
MQDKHSSSKLAQPLSIGNVVNVGLQIYRDQGPAYFKIALQATLWLLAPILLGLVGVALGLILELGAGLLVLLGLGWFVLLMYCLARYLAESALISRLTYAKLINQPESLAEARRFTSRRSWAFLWLYILLMLLYFGLLLGLFLALGILIAIVFAAFGMSTLMTSETGGAISLTIGLVLYVGSLIAILLLLLWLGMRLYFISEVPLAVEAITPGAAIGRSWVLTKGNFWRVFWVAIVVTLILIPIQLLQQAAASTLQGMLAVVAAPESPAFTALVFLITMAMALLLGIIILPLWQSIEATLYYDLRSRREGLTVADDSGSGSAEPQDRRRASPQAPSSRAASNPPGVSPLRWLQRVSVVTPESVDLQFLLAGIGGRGFAFAVDVAILISVWAIGAMIYSLVALQLLDYLSRTDWNYDAVPIWLGAIAFLATFILFTGYFVFFEVRWQGQTPGKRAAHIRVIREDGRPVGLSQAVLRSLLLAFDGVPLFLGVFFILFGKQEKRLGDLVAGTLVVQDAQSPTQKIAIRYSDRAQRLAKELPAITNLSALTPDDLTTIRDYLERRPHLERDARRDLSLTLARQLRSQVGLKTIQGELTSDDFLEALYLAYQAQMA